MDSLKRNLDTTYYRIIPYIIQSLRLKIIKILNYKEKHHLVIDNVNVENVDKINKIIYENCKLLKDRINLCKF